MSRVSPDVHMVCVVMNAASERMSSIQDQPKLIHTEARVKEPCQIYYKVANFCLEVQHSFSSA